MKKKNEKTGKESGIRIPVNYSLLKWFQEQFENSSYTSYRSLQEATNGEVNFRAWHRLLVGKTTVANEKVVKWTCEIFSVTVDELMEIATSPGYKDAEKTAEMIDAMSVWRWLSQDSRRAGSLRCMGYKGRLPSEEG